MKKLICSACAMIMMSFALMETVATETVNSLNTETVSRSFLNGYVDELEYGRIMIQRLLDHANSHLTNRDLTASEKKSLTQQIEYWNSEKQEIETIKNRMEDYRNSLRELSCDDLVWEWNHLHGWARCESSSCFWRYEDGILNKDKAIHKMRSETLSQMNDIMSELKERNLDYSLYGGELRIEKQRIEREIDDFEDLRRRLCPVLPRSTKKTTSQEGEIDCVIVNSF